LHGRRGLSLRPPSNKEFGSDATDKVLERLLRDELKAVNYMLPKKRKNLKELLGEEYPHVPLRDGGTHMFRRSELQKACRILGKELCGNLFLPIILEMRAELKEVVAEVEDPVAIKLICKVLDINEPRKPPLRLYPVHLRVLRREIGTLLMYAISFRRVLEEEL